jgi:hypothetical protein
MKSDNFTYKKAEKKCPSCGELMLSAIGTVSGYLFCEREHGTRSPKWHTCDLIILPMATRTARAGRFTIEGEEGFWKIPSHIDMELTHDGPEEGAVIAAIWRYRSKIPTAVVFVRGKSPTKLYRGS